MQEGVILTFKGAPQKKRLKILKALKTMGLTEINSQHDTYNDRYIYEMFIDGDIPDINVRNFLEDDEFKVEEDDDFKVEAGVG